MPSAKRRLRSGRFGRHATTIGKFFSRDVWSRELTTLPTLHRYLYRVARVTHLAASNFVKDRCTWRASALTYITVLSLVPMLAFAFSVAKGLGAYERLRDGTIEPLLDRTFGTNGEARDPVVTMPEVGVDEQRGGERTAEGARADASEPLLVGPPFIGDTDSGPPPVGEAAEIEAKEEGAGPEVRAAIDTVLHFVQETNVASLGGLGLGIVVWTVLQLLGSIERSFNDIWGVRRSRTIARKLSDYLSTLVLVPLLLVTATGVANASHSERIMVWLGLDAAGRDLSFLIVLPVVAAGFAFAYLFMPNTRVRLSSALIGGFVGGTLWQLFQVAHLKLQLGVANYNAIYSTFAALPIFLFWVYASWVTVLLGAEVAAAHQNEASHHQVLRARDFDQGLKEVVAVRLAVRLARAFSAAEEQRTIPDYANELGVPERTIDEVAAALQAGGLVALADTGDEDEALLLTRDPARVRLQDVYDALSGKAGPSHMQAEDPLDARLDAAQREYDAARRASDLNRTLAELVALEPPPRDARPREAAAGRASAGEGRRDEPVPGTARSG